MTPGSKLFFDALESLDATREHVAELDLLDERIDDLLDYGSPLDAEDRDPELIEFLRLTRAGDPVPLDITSRLAAKGYDLEALEASALRL